MAALSVYSDWEKPAGFTTTGEFIASSEVAEALIGFLEPFDCPLFSIDDIFNTASDDPIDNFIDAAHDNFFAAVPDNLSDAAHDRVFAAVPDNLFDPENDLLSSPSPPGHCSLHCCAKRHRCCYSDEPQQELCFESNPFAAEFAPAEPPEPHYFRPTPLAELPEPLPLPQYFEQTPFSAEFAFDPPPKTTSGCGLSVQSAAARGRRKRISDKTQELSRLIPGGGKMNTAEMLLAGQKYVRYLQAQISILKLDTCDKEQSGEEDDLLRVLISSAAIQEKLSKQGMCLVPTKLVAEFAADPQLKFNPFMEREINKFSELIGEKA